MSPYPSFRSLAAALICEEDAMTHIGAIVGLILGVAVFGGVSAVLLPSAAHADCFEWNLSGLWRFELENGRWVDFNLTQTRHPRWKDSDHFILTGNATYNRPPRPDAGRVALRRVDGRLRGSKFSLSYIVDDLPEIDDESVIFEGVIDGVGAISGTGPNELDIPTARMNWHEKAGRKATCTAGGAGGSADAKQGQAGSSGQGERGLAPLIVKQLPQGPTARGDDMQPGETLGPHQSLTSANGRYTLQYQGDGNLVLYDRGRPLWASNTAGKPVGVCIMQGDGNLVVYIRDSVVVKPIWASNTAQHPGSRLIVQNDGNVVIYRPDRKPVWATNTVQQ